MARKTQTFRKDPDAVLDYGFDWSDWLATGEAISVSTWTVPTGITKDSDASADSTTTIWLSGGTDGTTYTLTNHITTDAGREDDRSFDVIVEER